ncbi:cytochrome c oxidase subunit 3 [Microbulbifer flavimaris]|uniref:cytochrome-c oxidase n=1 Tax=Microbulbifer flavimaris TaxID=1781068 RepID=A0ABX4HYV5_9GAMM|nr:MULTISPECIES: cytochrome c oxidase subunit 3 [Microbulbifer]KUJ83061.1 MFS transporter [Microbulbifer sp. ZGT114]PCO05246.1 cytochrome c oxidase subunit 3 [Microbulbifer flavimaris]
MATESSYYVPEQSRLPIFATIGLFMIAFGAANWINGGSAYIFFAGSLAMAAVLWFWFSAVIRENMAGLNSDQLKRSYVWGMGWFIFSEVMFFAAFFGALYYIRTFALPWLGGEGDRGTSNMLWEGFENNWPLMVTPDAAAHGDAAKIVGPKDIIDPWHLPLLNTIILLASSFTVHVAHVYLKKNKRKAFNIWLTATVALGFTFLYFQAVEYYEAYVHLGLTLESGIYGTTFFMLTGFHGAHVTLGTIMLLIMLLRSVIAQHFKPDDHFGFEAASWYWHFVDVVWVALFIFVYVLGG